MEVVMKEKEMVLEDSRDNGKQNNMALDRKDNHTSSKTGMERTIEVHPLIIVNICDHHTRTFAGNSISELKDDNQTRVLGAFFGVQKGLEVSVYDSFEFPYTLDSDGKIIIERDYIKSRIEQFAAIYPSYELMGWYSVNAAIQSTDLDVHRSMMEFNESPLFLLLDPSSGLDSDSLPISIYESEVHMIKGNPQMLFVKSSYKVEAVEAERIAIDQVAKVTPSSDGTISSLTLHLGSLKDAVGLLSKRIKILHTCINQVHSGKIPMDHNVLRHINSICNQIPVLTTDEFREHFLREYNDSLMVTYLSSITKATMSTNQIIDKFLTIQDSRRQRGHTML